MTELIYPGISLAGFGLAVFMVKRSVAGSETRMTATLAGTETRMTATLTMFKTEISASLQELKKETKERADEIQDDLGKLEEKHHACQRVLPLAYASKTEATELFSRQRKVEEDLSFFRGRLNSAAQQG